MIPPSLRRTVLAAAAVAVLSLPAAAQSDAAFAAALGKAPSALATMAQLKTAVQAPAAAKAKGPTVPAAAWTEMLNKAMRDGRRESEDSDTRWLQEVAGDPDGEHTRRLLMVFLVLDENDRIVTDGGALSLATYTWAPAGPDGIRRLLVSEAWTLLISGSGEVTEAAIVTTLGNAQIGYEEIGNVMVDAADPRVKVRLDEMFKRWSTRLR